jgi:hypothetical protein
MCEFVLTHTIPGPPPGTGVVAAAVVRVAGAGLAAEVFVLRFAAGEAVAVASAFLWARCFAGDGDAAGDSAGEGDAAGDSPGVGD